MDRFPGPRGRSSPIAVSLLAASLTLPATPLLAQTTGAEAAARTGATGRVGAAQPEDAAAPAPNLDLQEAVLLALEQNRELQDARLGLEGAEGQVREAWGSVYPTLDLTTSYTRNLTVPATFVPARFGDPNAGPEDLVAVKFGADNQWGLQLRAEQPLFEATAFLGVGAAERYRRLQNEIVRGRAQQIATRVRIAYYDVLLAQEGVRLAENSFDRVTRTLTETQALYRAGLSSEYDVLRLQVERGNLEPNLRRSRNAVEAATRTLAVELGLEPSDTLRLEGSLTAVEPDLLAAEEAAPTFVLTGGGVPEATPLEDLLQQASASRSDLRQLALTENLRRTELRVEQVGYLPEVSLFGTYSISAQGNDGFDFFETADRRAYGRQVGVQVTLPLFSGFQRPARIEQKRAVVRQVETQRALAADRAENEVETLMEQRTESLERAEAQRLAVSQAQRGYEIARAQYREGIGSQLEVTDAELALRQSEYNYAQAVYDYLVSRARLDQAVGRVPFVDDGANAPLRTAGNR